MASVFIVRLLVVGIFWLALELETIVGLFCCKVKRQNCLTVVKNQLYLKCSTAVHGNGVHPQG